jgi:hypothetical protein
VLTDRKRGRQPRAFDAEQRDDARLGVVDHEVALRVAWPV